MSQHKYAADISERYFIWKQQSHLVEVQPTRESSHIELPSPRVSNPSISFVLGITMRRPLTVGKYLDQFLCLRVTVRVTDITWLLQMEGVPRTAVEMISRIWKPRCLISIYYLTVETNMIRWARNKVIRTAPTSSFWIYYHLTVSGYICQNITITWIPIVLPTASYIKKIKLATCPSSFFDIKCQSHLKVWTLRKLKNKMLCSE